MPTFAVAEVATVTAPVPAVIIRAGETLSAEALVSRRLVVNEAAARSYAVAREQVVGKVARRTLLAGAAIPLNAIRDPWLFKDGERVVIVFGFNGLNIRGAGVALQPGVAGEAISVRNIDSGVVVRGVVLSDGNVRVGGSE